MSNVPADLRAPSPAWLRGADGPTLVLIKKEAILNLMSTVTLPAPANTPSLQHNCTAAHQHPPAGYTVCGSISLLTSFLLSYQWWWCVGEGGGATFQT